MLGTSHENALEIIAGGATDIARISVGSGIKASAADVSLMVACRAIQLHGGIGFTNEHAIGLFVRRTMVLANASGPSGLIVVAMQNSITRPIV